MQVAAGTGTVGIVAVGAAGFALADGVVRGQLGFGSYPGMAVQAHVGRLLGGECRIDLLMAVVTAVAGHSLGIVCTAGPEQLLAAVVTGLAAGVARFGCRWPLGTEAD